VAEQSKFSATRPAVRTRLAYFDCRFGQLHVRTAFPSTGGFDEGVTLFCLHPSNASSRIFDRFLHEIAEDRSVYAPDLPGFGESDAAPVKSYAEAANAVGDLAADLGLRRIDVLGFGLGAGAALALAAARPQLVRRLVLVGVPPIDSVPAIAHESLVLRVKLGGADDSQWEKAALSRAKFVDLPEYAADLFEAAPKTLAKQVAAFLAAKP
jgi:pimeloyl-ACP methyl ester carboxylesterase